jgi:hypothetical protein
MKQIPLYIDSHKKYFYVTDEELNCDSCGVELVDIVFIRIQWSARSQLGCLCFKCTNNNMFQAQIEEWKIARVTNVRRNDFVPIIIVFPGIKNSDRDLTVFDTDSIKSDNVIDKTRYANIQSYDGVVIGRDVSEELSVLDNPDVDTVLLDRIVESEVIIPKLLEEVKK